MDLWGIADYVDDSPCEETVVKVSSTNVRVLFAERANSDDTQSMLSDYGLVVHNTRCDLLSKVYHVAVQDLLLVVLRFGKGSSYNEALTDSCNQALRYREAVLKKRA